MNKSDPHPNELKEVNSGDDAPSPEKHPKKIRTSPPVEDEDSPLLDKQSSSLSSSGSTASNSPNSTSPRASIPPPNNNTDTRHDKDITEESLYHKRSSKQGKQKNKKDNQPLSWGTRLRTHPKPVVRFGTNNSPNSKKGSDEEPDESNDLPQERPPTPPSSPHPTDDVPLETLLKHGSGWAFPREQNGKMICIFRSCPQPLRGGTKKDYIDHLRLHQTMEHTPLYSMLRNAPPGGLLPPGDGSGDVPSEEAPMSQLDGEWEGDEEDADDDGEGSVGGSGTQSGTSGSGGGGATNGGAEEELHTPKLSQRGLQLRAQMMKYGLNIFRQDSEGRYLCFFMGCTMRMTTNFSRHIAKHEKKMDAISPDLVHLLKEGSTLDKPYMKVDKKTKDGNPLSMMMASSHLIPPPHHSLSHHGIDGMDMGEHGPPPHHSMMSSLDMRDYRGPPPSPHLHMQHSLQHMHLQHSSPPSPGQYMQHISPHLSLPPPHHLPHSQYRHPLTHMDVHRPPPTSGTPPPGGLSSSSPTNPSEIRWVYRSPLPSPLSLPLTSPRRSSLTDSESTPTTHSPLKGFPPPPIGVSHRNPNPLSSSSPSPSLPRLSSEGDSPHDPPLSISPTIPDTKNANSSTLLPTTSSQRPSSSQSPLPDLGAVATSLLDLRKM